MKTCLATGLWWCLLASGCTPETSFEAEEDTGSAEQPERWSNQDAPSLFSQNVERRAAAIPRSGEASPMPWPGSHWPMSRDSINARWDGPGSDSPAKKYERAFGVSGVEDAVSRYYGIDSRPQAKVCSAAQACEDGEVCGKRAGESSGRCVPTWYGMCHGWAAAAMLFPEPERSVVVNGVTFELQDIKALLSLAHGRTTARYIALRCNEADADGEIRYDQYGRPSPRCRDTNPGTFHVILGTYLGIRRQPFLLDRVFDEHVWNHPVRGYEIVEETPVTVEQALRLLHADPPNGQSAPEYVFNNGAAELRHVKTDVKLIGGAAMESSGRLSSRVDSYTDVKRYEYVLELDAAGVIIGGEWVGDSRKNHPDFLWLPSAAALQSVAGGKIDVAKVKQLARDSVAPRAPGP